MKTFDAILHENEIENQIRLEISGVIGHECLLPEIITPTNLLIVDMENVRSINSFGINIWIRWAEKSKNIEKIILKMVPAFFIKQIQYFSNLIPENIEISSFFVPYYDEITDEQKLVLFTDGTHFKRGIFVNFPTVISSANNPMSMDVDANKYFAFLKAPIKVNS